jgi:hypothetical protein
MGTDDGENVVPFVPTDGDGNPLVVVEEPVALAPVVKEAAPPPPAPAPPPRIKVNGVEIDLTAELIAKAQKIASADQYLEEASTRRSATPSPTPAPATPDPGVEAARLEEERALVRAIQVGTEDEAIAALRKIRVPANNGMDARQVAQITDERLAFSTAISKFNTDYKDLVEDPQLHQMVLARDQALVAENDPRPYSERYTAIGNEIRAWRDGLVAKFAPPAAAPVDPVAAKLARKANAPVAPPAASARATPPADEDDGEEDVSSVIAKMAAARGGPQWTRA